MSKKKRIGIIVILTTLVVALCAYVCKIVLPREDFRPIDMFTVGLTIMAVYKNIKLILIEVKNHDNK